VISPRDAFRDPVAFSRERERARPLPPDDRRDAIAWAVLPLIKEQGRAVTSRQLAEAAGVAEGTLFRAFGDKETLIAAAIEKLFDPVPFHAALRAIPADRTLDEKLHDILFHLRERMTGMFGVMASLGIEGRPPVTRPAGDAWVAIIGEVLAPHLDELSVDLETLAHYLRLVAFASALPPFNESREFRADELARLVGRGVLRREKEN
jgi:AcrR family transcriptional regulator